MLGVFWGVYVYNPSTYLSRLYTRKQLHFEVGPKSVRNPPYVLSGFLLGAALVPVF
jgi:hypothetical protein